MANYNQIPQELRKLKQWTCWGKKGNAEEMKKVPINPITNQFASATDEKTWVDYDTAIKFVNDGTFEGLGIFFANGLMGIDLDHVITNNRITSEAKHIIDVVDSYTETSPSMTGIHILCFGDKPNGRCKTSRGVGTDFEMYDKDRYFRLTGNVVAKKYNVNERTKQVAVIHKTFFEEEKKTNQVQQRNLFRRFAVPSSNNDLFSNMMKVEKLKRLWSGNLIDYSEDHSRGDLALCCYLAYFTNGDSQMIDELFQQSGLMREKWNRKDYKQRTIQEAIATCQSNFYERETKKGMR